MTAIFERDTARELWEAVEESRGGTLGEWMPWVKPAARAFVDAAARICRGLSGEQSAS